jgi:hypothetical protein
VRHATHIFLEQICAMLTLPFASPRLNPTSSAYPQPTTRVGTPEQAQASGFAREVGLIV